MNLNKRFQSPATSGDLSPEEAMELIHDALSGIVESCWLIGYTANGHEKVCVRVAKNAMGRDALEVIEPVVSAWCGDSEDEEGC